MTDATFSFDPEGDDDPIVVPASSVLWEDVDGKTPLEFLWEIRKLNEAYQSFEFMDRAKIADDVQRRIVRLTQKERRRFFDAWFADVNAPDVNSGLPPES